jgi:DeoR/GlpR family transcriptional regulator of sugar metabolism
MLNGMYTQQVLQSLHVQKAFIAASAVHSIYGMTNPNANLVPLKQWMIGAAKQIIVVADHTKLGRVSLHTVAPVQSLDKMVTGSEIGDKQPQLFREAGVEVIMA